MEFLNTGLPPELPSPEFDYNSQKAITRQVHGRIGRALEGPWYRDTAPRLSNQSGK